MELNYKNAALQEPSLQAVFEKTTPPYPILHFGVGGFHRAHQAWALQGLLNDRRPELEHWGITGVGVLPQDAAFAKTFRNQDCLYFLQRFAPEGLRDTQLISSIKEMLHVSEDYETILARIAAPETRIISFTITEGGYNVDYTTNTFIWDTPVVQEDLLRRDVPKTVFRVLAEGLKKRSMADGGAIVLMSCDNVQHNGDILRLALIEFLKRFDPSLIDWVAQHVTFVKTMVDRITPATTRAQKEAFEKTGGFHDQCLVVCEEYFQWIIEEHPGLAGLPLRDMGATVVKEVAPYEKMKLRLLNGGHSLTGLLGEALGYDRIHTAIKDDNINAVFQRYCSEEVIPTLDPIAAVHYPDYVQQLVYRFGNPMINDSTARIISGSTDKLPKFVLPVISEQLKRQTPKIKCGVLILAAWYYYLEEAFKKDQMEEVQDLNRELLLALFSEPDWDACQFITRLPVLHTLQREPVVQTLFLEYVQALRVGEIHLLINQLLH
ncbi:mannitol dehydrogenase family protein [Niabella soli]|uniref:mannitol dehydrogenase family protein n=1 Tax=Niabella soli TaxID=446683 RepID=UPI0002499084|nr:mannitol dehydrogenase family protein [Niabella soli]